MKFLTFSFFWSFLPSGSWSETLLKDKIIRYFVYVRWLVKCLTVPYWKSKKTFQYTSWNHFPSKALKQRTILSMKKPTKTFFGPETPSELLETETFANFFLHQITGGQWKKSIIYKKEKISERTSALVGKCVESINKLTHSHLNITSVTHSKI